MLARAAASITTAFDDPALIAAGTTGTTADNGLCLNIAALRETTSINGATYTGEYSRIAASAGLLVTTTNNGSPPAPSPWTNSLPNATLLPACPRMRRW
jgi:flagellar hook-associated protein 1 FlgK